MKKLLLLSVILASLLLVPVISLAQTEDLGTTAAGAGIGIVCLILWIIFALAMLALLIFWIFMLVDVIKRPDDAFPNPGPNTKIVWILVVVLASWIGSLIYYFAVKKKMEG